MSAALSGDSDVWLASCRDFHASPFARRPGAGCPVAVWGCLECPNAVFTTRHLAGLGTVLVSASGRTIYSPEQEAHGQIRCTGSCLSFWFPVTVTSATGLHAPSGLTGVLGTIHRRDDGRTQLTYNGRPLYTFKLDQSPGQARGSNFTDSFGGTSFTWQAVTSRGAASGSGGGAAPTGGPGYQGGSGY